MTNIGLLFDAPILLGSLFLINKFKGQIAKLFLKIRLPTFIVSLISAIPFIIIEENINCGAFQCNYTLLPPTLLPLLIYMALVGFLFKKLKPKNTTLVMGIFSFIGLLFEFFFGYSRVEFRQLPPFWFAFISFWVLISYAYLMIVPLQILKMETRRPKRK
ncbi:MAG: hypothetical protein KC535_02065 [Nanoarchaeota archaeon]|nr:hypothetical protein [Nanoarchaeota archaeon]